MCVCVCAYIPVYETCIYGVHTTYTHTHTQLNVVICVYNIYLYIRTCIHIYTYVAVMLYGCYIACCCRRRVVCVCALAHELFARGPTDFEITCHDWLALAVYIKSANGGRANGSSAARTPCSPRYVIQHSVLPTDQYHVHLPGIYICSFFFLLFFR